MWLIHQMCVNRCGTVSFPLHDTGEKRHSDESPSAEPGVPPHSARRQVRRRAAASVEMWQSNAAPVGTPHAVNASPNYSLRRKSLPWKAIHRFRPRVRHLASRGQYVTVTQCGAPGRHFLELGADRVFERIHRRPRRFAHVLLEGLFRNTTEPAGVDLHLACAVQVSGAALAQTDAEYRPIIKGCEHFHLMQLATFQRR
jgi:hypothetical protein